MDQNIGGRVGERVRELIVSLPQAAPLHMARRDKRAWAVVARLLRSRVFRMCMDPLCLLGSVALFIVENGQHEVSI